MRCHYTYDPESKQKIHIPGCMGAAALGINNCTCYSSRIETFGQFEKRLYNEKLSELSEKVKELEKYNAQLQRIIKRLIKPHKTKPQCQNTNAKEQ